MSQSICTHNTVFKIKKSLKKKSSNLRKHFHDIKPVKIVGSIQILLLESKGIVTKCECNPAGCLIQHVRHINRFDSKELWPKKKFFI